MTTPLPERAAGPDGQDRAVAAVKRARKTRRLSVPAPDAERPGAGVPAGLPTVPPGSLNAAITNATS